MYTSQLLSRKAAAASKIAIACSVASLGMMSATPASASFTLGFNDFADSAARAQFQTNGDAAFAGRNLRLVPDAQSKAGSAFLRQGYFINSQANFSTQFNFQVTSAANLPAMRSDGLAFVIQGSGPGLLGQGGGNLGYIGPLTSNGAPLSIFPYFYAVEFDTYRNKSTGDVSDNHIAITRTDPGGTEIIGSVDLTAEGLPLLDDGTVKNVRIVSSGADRRLSVFLPGTNDPTEPVLSAVLPDALFHFGGASTFFGFTAATGRGYANYDIRSWQYSVAGPSAVPEPGSLALFAIGALALFAARRGSTAACQCAVQT